MSLELRPEEQADGADSAVADLYREMAAADLQALWTQAEQLMGLQPRPGTSVWHWPWRRLRELAERAGQLVPIERGGERRALALSNPGLGGRPFATNTLWAAIQYLGPRESAPAHRHTAAAIRFVIEGRGAFTTVNGERCPMSRGDLVLTPNWTWHEHHNPTDESVIWFDGLDLPLVSALDAIFYENYPELSRGDSEGLPAAGRARYGYAGLLPIRPDTSIPHSPLMIYPWEQTDAALHELLATSDEPSATLRFSNPVDGADALPTMRCAMTRLRGDRRTPVTQVVGSQVVLVHEGSGESVVAGRRIVWSAGDVFTVPSWAPLEHLSDEPADLFILGDQPVLERLALARESRWEGAQSVTDEVGR